MTQPTDTPEVPRTPNALETGPDVILRYWKQLPASPGVYRMLDAAGEVIYVGKARSLKARVANYTRLLGHTNRIARMITATASMEFVTVRTEAEALLLEANLIKRFRPRFNVLLRDDKSFPYIVIRTDQAAPMIGKHRGARNTKGQYFGPFASAGAVNRTINMMQRAFLLRSCTDSVFATRTRPCLLHQIKRCAGPCTNEIPPEDYRKLVDESVAFLRGESQNVRQHYQKLMEDAAEKLEFEEAARFRNRLWALAHVTADQSINPEGIEEADVFAAYQDGGQTCIQVFFFRTGQNWGNRAYYPRADRSLEPGEVLDSFVAQFYDDKPVPRLILLSHDIAERALLAEALSIKADRKVEISVPQRGAKVGVVEHALTNAREALGRKLAETSSQRKLLEGLKERFDLPRVPRRIEVFDNSHISGAHAVGAMITAGPQGFAKNAYRKFNIKSDSITPGDDYGMMREVLTRRFKRIAEAQSAPSPPTSGGEGRGEGRPLAPIEIEPLAQSVDMAVARSEAADHQASAPHPNPLPLKEGEREPSILDENERDPEDAEDEASPLGDDDFPDIPDLVLVDGGAGQLAVAIEIMRELGVRDVSLVGVAKGPDRDAGREHFHFPGRAKTLMLEARDPVLYFVQRLRDEAHRFAIGTHRAKRSKAISANPLNDIEGIGPTRKRALLTHFGSAKAVSRAGIEDLKAVKGINADMAQKIYDFFQKDG